jgi:hypothetical protein
MRSELFSDITQLRVVIMYRRFGTTSRSPLQRSRKSWTYSPLKMGPRGCPETSAQNYHSALRNIREERRSQHQHTYCHQSLLCTRNVCASASSCHCAVTLTPTTRRRISTYLSLDTCVPVWLSESHYSKPASTKCLFVSIKLHGITFRQYSTLTVFPGTLRRKVQGEIQITDQHFDVETSCRPICYMTFGCCLECTGRAGFCQAVSYDCPLGG